MKQNTPRLIFIASLLLSVNVTYAAPEKPDSGLHGADVIKENEPPQMRGLDALRDSDITSTQSPSVEDSPTFKESLKELEKKNSPQKKLTPEPKPD